MTGILWAEMASLHLSRTTDVVVVPADEPTIAAIFVRRFDLRATSAGTVDHNAGLEMRASMASQVRAWPTLFVVMLERSAAPTLALDADVRLSMLAQERRLLAVSIPVFCKGSENLKILRHVVAFVPVYMVHLFALAQSASDLLFGDDPMLVHVPCDVCKMVLRILNENVSAWVNYASAFPVRVLLTLHCVLVGCSLSAWYGTNRQGATMIVTT
jgi:hypothetical protein